jgi:hypothetical protein
MKQFFIAVLVAVAAVTAHAETSPVVKFHYETQATCPPNPLCCGKGGDSLKINPIINAGANTTGSTQYFAYDVKKDGVYIGQVAWNISATNVLTVTSSPTLGMASAAIPQPPSLGTFTIVNAQASTSSFIPGMSATPTTVAYTTGSVCDNSNGVEKLSDVTFYCMGASAPPPPSIRAPYEILSSCLENTQWQLQVNGVVVKSLQGSGSNAAPYAVSGTFTGTTGYSSAPTVKWVRQWHTSTSGSYREFTPTVTLVPGSETQSAYYAIGSYSDTVSCGVTPTPTPTATPVGTPAPTPTPTPIPPATPRPSAPATVTVRSGTGALTDVIVANPQDIYNPIVDAIRQLTGENASTVAPTPMGFAGVDTSDRGQLDNLSGKVQSSIDSTNAVVGNFQTGIASASNFTSLPTSYGTVATITIPVGALVPGMANQTITLSEWASEINIIRKLALWGITIMFAYLSLRALTYQN